jgi:hypothetical protein
LAGAHPGVLEHTVSFSDERSCVATRDGKKPAVVDLQPRRTIAADIIGLVSLVRLMHRDTR